MNEPEKVLKEDPILAPIVEEHGPVEIQPATDPFERLIISIVRQQLSMDSAAAIKERLFETVEIHPSTLRTVDSERLQSVGLSAQKAQYIKSVAGAYEDNEYSRERFEDWSNEAIRDELTQIAGIGPWTAKMFLIFGLGREDVFPVEDLGIRRGIETLFNSDLSRAEMCQRAQQWRPYRSYAALYIWRAHEG